MAKYVHQLATTMRRTTKSSVNDNKDTTRRTSISEKKTTLNPKSRQLSKMADEESLPMEKKPAPDVETVLQYAIPLTGPETRIKAESTKNEITQICNKLNEHTRALEEMYDESSEKVTRNLSPVEEKPLSSFMSTCQSATSELDINIHAVLQILESLQLWYAKEVQLLEQPAETDMTTGDNAPASPDVIAAFLNQVTQIFNKLDEIKKQFQELPKTSSQIPPPAPVSPFKTEKNKKTARLPVTPNRKNEANYQGTQNVVRKLQNLSVNKDGNLNEALKKIAQEVGETINSQEKEFQQLENEYKETERKYTKMKAEYQIILEEKIIIENELKQVLNIKVAQKRPNSVTTKAEYKPDKVMLTNPPAMTADGPQPVLPEQEPETFLKQTDDTKMENFHELPPSGGSSPQKKINLQMEERKDLLKIQSTKSQDQKTLHEAFAVSASAGETQQIKESVRLHSETRPPLATVEAEITQEIVEKVNMMTQNIKSAEDQENRTSTSSTKTMTVTAVDNTASHINQLSVIPEMKPSDSSGAEIQGEAKKLTDGSILTTDPRKHSAEEKIQPKSDLVHGDRHSNHIVQPDRVTATVDSSETSITISKSLDAESSRGKSISIEQKQTSLLEQRAKKEEEEGQGTLGKTKVLSVFPTKQENEKMEHMKGSLLTPSFVTTEDERLLSAGYDFPYTPFYEEETFSDNSSGHHTNSKYKLSDFVHIAVSDVSGIVCDIPPAGSAEEHQLTSKSLSETSTDTMIYSTKTILEYMPSDISIGDLGKTQLSDGAIETTQSPVPPRFSELSEQKNSGDSKVHESLLQEPQKTQLSTMLIETNKEIPSTPYRDIESQFILREDTQKTQLSTASITIQMSAPQRVVKEISSTPRKKQRTVPLEIRSQELFSRDSKIHNVYLEQLWGTKEGSQDSFSREDKNNDVYAAEPCGPQISTPPMIIKRTVPAEILCGYTQKTQLSTAPITIQMSAPQGVVKKFSRNSESHNVYGEEPRSTKSSTAAMTTQKTVSSERKPHESLSIDGEGHYVYLTEHREAQISTAALTTQGTIPIEIGSQEPSSRDGRIHNVYLAELWRPIKSLAPRTTQGTVPSEIRSQEPSSRGGKIHNVYLEQLLGTKESSQDSFSREDKNNDVYAAEPCGTQISTGPITTQRKVPAKKGSQELFYRDGEVYSIHLGQPQKMQISKSPIRASQSLIPPEITDGNLPSLPLKRDKRECFLQGESEKIKFSAGNTKTFLDFSGEENSVGQYLKVRGVLRTHLHAAETPPQVEPETSLHLSRDGNILKDWKTQMSTSFYTRKLVPVFLKRNIKHSPMPYSRDGESSSDPWRTQPSAVSVHPLPSKRRNLQTQISSGHQHGVLYVIGKSILQPQKSSLEKGTEADFVDIKQETEYSRESSTDPWRTQPSAVSVHPLPSTLHNLQTQVYSGHRHEVLYVIGKSILKPQKSSFGKGTEADCVDNKQETDG